jgi:hypothetical protein
VILGGEKAMLDCQLAHGNLQNLIVGDFDYRQNNKLYQTVRCDAGLILRLVATQSQQRLRRPLASILLPDCRFFRLIDFGQAFVWVGQDAESAFRKPMRSEACMGQRFAQRIS